jgi:colanic acid biosynthesis glycosyl transferase WcaI
MNIVLLNLFFWPETVATSQILTEVVRSLGEEHEVTVICGRGGAKPSGSEEGSEPNVEILRIHNSGFGHSTLVRVASYITYLAGVIWHCCLLGRPDCIVTLTTPPVLSVIGGIFARLRGARHVIWEMDVYPDIATDIGYFKKGGITERISGAVLDWSRRRANVIIALGEEMKALLVARGIPEAKIHVAENWANGLEIVPLPFPDGPLTVCYSGNLGLAHEVATIAAVVDRLANDARFRFIFAGGGPRRAQLESFCEERRIENVEFRSFCANAELGQSLAEGHVGLVTQISQTLGSVVPSKIYGIMAAGRPLLYIGPDKATPAQHIRHFGCGWRIEPGDADGAIRLLSRLHLNRQLLLNAGALGREAFVQNFDRPIGVGRILSIILGSNSLTVQPDAEHNQFAGVS